MDNSGLQQKQNDSSYWAETCRVDQWVSEPCERWCHRLISMRRSTDDWMGWDTPGLDVVCVSGQAQEEVGVGGHPMCQIDT